MLKNGNLCDCVGHTAKVPKPRRRKGSRSKAGPKSLQGSPDFESDLPSQLGFDNPKVRSRKGTECGLESDIQWTVTWTMWKICGQCPLENVAVSFMVT